MSDLTSLDELLRAIHNAGIEAQKLTEQQHMRQLRRYFNEDGTPLTMPIKIPNPNYDPRAEAPPLPARGQPAAPPPTVDLRTEPYVAFDAPLLSLIPPAALKIKALDVRFKVRLQGMMSPSDSTSKNPLTGKDELSKGPLHIELGGGMFGRKSQMADITITFEGADPPESIMKINDHFLRSFP